MKILVASIRTYPLAVSVVSLCSLALLLIKTIWLNRIPACFALAPSLGILFEGLLSATVAAYLFFIISVQLPQVLERKLLGDFIAAGIDSVANRVTGFLQMIAGSTGDGILDQTKVDGQKVQELFSRVSPNDPSPQSTDIERPTLSWIRAMVYQDELRIQRSDRLLQQFGGRRGQLLTLDKIRGERERLPRRTIF